MTEAEAAAGALPVQRGTMLRATLLGGAILAAVAAASWLGGQEQAASPLERFQRLGPAGAAAALKAELAQDFPPGTPVTPLLQRLQGLGLACNPPTGERAGWECALAFRTEGQRSTQLRASIGVAGDRILGIETAAETRN
jgi:hypothetical protein